ncbi:HEPN domain-containing protein [Lentzea sp. DG1S-22]|uniref:HEPN domain-containing protein n=1 Tax=Lentzea sp. DG1S-22 TaxID=3108822 RepID=UPI002E762079|nr:HEPN domain-containing protein [Lentzea sp. DG1S-22]WVH79221.1 HEPN domain-containing protein [Lentzea sp. DG1S-22]
MNWKKAAHSTSARHQIERLKESLEELYIRSDPKNVGDPEIASDLGNYLCVRVSGYIEQASGVIFRDYCHKNAGGAVQHFAVSWLDRMPNMSADPLIKLVSRFSKELASELEEFLGEEERRGRLNALVGVRNDVAHGRQQGLSRERAWSYFELAEEVIEWLLNKFDSMNAPTK